MGQTLKPNRSDNRGGSANCGRKKLGNILYQRRFSPELVEKMDIFLNNLKQKEMKSNIKQLIIILQEEMKFTNNDNSKEDIFYQKGLKFAFEKAIELDNKQKVKDCENCNYETIQEIKFKVFECDICKNSN